MLFQGKEEGGEKVRTLDFDGSLEETGCNELNEEVLLCMGEHRDWRKCQKQVKAFKQCFEDFQLLKLYYYSELINERELAALLRARKWGTDNVNATSSGPDASVAEGGKRTMLQNPYEDSRFKVSQNLKRDFFEKEDRFKTPADNQPVPEPDKPFIYKGI